jgi:hypothetical protein
MNLILKREKNQVIGNLKIVMNYLSQVKGCIFGNVGLDGTCKFWHNYHELDFKEKK